MNPPASFFRARNALLLVVLSNLTWSTCITQADEPTAPAPKFVIYASAEDAPMGTSLLRILHDQESVTRIEKTQSIDRAAESEADVIVVVAPRRRQLDVSKETLNRLKGRKIIGIGYGAAELFGEMGLEIEGGNCAHFTSAPDLKVVSSRLLGDRPAIKTFSILKDDVDLNIGPRGTDIFAMHLPPTSLDAKQLDAIARMGQQFNYTPIVRQRNCVLIGIPVPARLWSEEYANLVREVCRKLQARELEEFSELQRQLTKPGTYEFELAELGNANKPYGKMFYFRYDSPIQFKATLEHSGSNSVMLLFMGEKKRIHWTRRDAKQEEPLEIDIEITADDIRQLEGKHWSLKVTNFGRSAAKCKLTISAD